MTNKEAKENLLFLKKNCTDEIVEEAIDIAIEALENNILMPPLKAYKACVEIMPSNKDDTHTITNKLSKEVSKIIVGVIRENIKIGFDGFSVYGQFRFWVEDKEHEQ